MSTFGASMPPVLFLTNNDNTLELFRWIDEREPNTIRISSRLSVEDVRRLCPRFVISFNYRHILKDDVLELLAGHIVNVHCSVLPWNRGASPNFFSYYTNTPKGVTVHEMTQGLDKGDILLQEELSLSEEETFSSSYATLIEHVRHLVKDNWVRLSIGKLVGVQQPPGGSYHDLAELRSVRERYPFEWGDRVSDWKRRYGLS